MENYDFNLEFNIERPGILGGPRNENTLFLKTKKITSACWPKIIALPLPQQLAKTKVEAFSVNDSPSKWRPGCEKQGSHPTWKTLKTWNFVIFFSRPGKCLICFNTLPGIWHKKPEKSWNLGPKTFRKPGICYLEKSGNPEKACVDWNFNTTCKGGYMTTYYCSSLENKFIFSNNIKLIVFRFMRWW